MVQESRCVNCGLDIEKDYILLINGTEYTFDSFECAINFVAPRCTCCNAIVTGRGVHVGNEVYCSVTCSRAENYSPVVP